MLSKYREEIIFSFRLLLVLLQLLQPLEQLSLRHVRFSPATTRSRGRGDVTDDDIGTVRWFGDSWGAPVNDPRARLESAPVHMNCIRCGIPIHSDDQGISIPGPDGYVAYHLGCFFEELGITDGL